MVNNDQILSVVSIVVGFAFSLYTVERLRTGYLPGELFYEGLQDWWRELKCVNCRKIKLTHFHHCKIKNVLIASQYKEK